MAGELDPGPRQPHSARMSVAFDTLAAADALRAVGMEPDHARAIAAQLRAAAGAGDAVTRPDLEAALARLKTELLERMADTKTELLERITGGEREIMDRIAESEGTLRTQMAENDRSLRTQMAENDRSLRAQIAENDQTLRERITESERRTAALLWRLFGGIVAVAGVAVAAARYLPAGSVPG